MQLTSYEIHLFRDNFGYIEPFCTLLATSCQCGCLLLLLAALAAFDCALGAFGNFWALLGTFMPFLANSGHFWLFLIGYLKPFLATFGSFGGFWLPLAAFGFLLVTFSSF